MTEPKRSMRSFLKPIRFIESFDLWVLRSLLTSSTCRVLLAANHHVYQAKAAKYLLQPLHVPFPFLHDAGIGFCESDVLNMEG